MMKLDNVRITTENIDEIRNELPLDQAREVHPGDIITMWTMNEGGRQKESITLWGTHGMDRRAAYYNGGNSEWGDWTARGVLEFDDGGAMNAEGQPHEIHR
jgi:hypothetical protein